ncbi:MAG: dihydropteroate synthase [Gemmatimonadota bacterium]
MALDRPVVMGILNLTPDSFSDGGDLPTLERALERAAAMVGEGAGILDVGGESTRPGAAFVAEADERARVLPFIEEAALRFDVPISVDTRSSRVAREALAAGASIVNDVSGLAHDAAMARVVAESGAGVVLMHMRGDPKTMQERAVYHDVAAEVEAELTEAAERALRAGVPAEAIVLDPGFGFAKLPAHSLELLRELGRLTRSGFPLLVGPSRKGFIGTVVNRPPKERVEGTIAVCVAAYLRGARIFRVHDVGPVSRALAVIHASETGAGFHAGTGAGTA